MDLVSKFDVVSKTFGTENFWVTGHAPVPLPVLGGLEAAPRDSARQRVQTHWQLSLRCLWFRTLAA